MRVIDDPAVKSATADRRAFARLPIAGPGRGAGSRPSLDRLLIDFTEASAGADEVGARVDFAARLDMFPFEGCRVAFVEAEVPRGRAPNGPRPWRGISSRDSTTSRRRWAGWPKGAMGCIDRQGTGGRRAPPALPAPRCSRRAVPIPACRRHADRLAAQSQSLFADEAGPALTCRPPDHRIPA